MAGHNKFSKIKHQKAKNDGQKSKIFSKLVRFISVEAKKAGGNMKSPGLALAIEKAKKENMPNDTIDRAIKKATTDNSAAMENVTYEAYGPGGVAIIIGVSKSFTERTITISARCVIGGGIYRNNIISRMGSSGRHN